MNNLPPIRKLVPFPKHHVRICAVVGDVLVLVATLSIASPSAGAQRSAEDRTLQAMYLSGLTDSAIAYTRRH